MKILLATDGSQYAERAAKKGFEFIKAKDDLEIKIISVAEPVGPVVADPFGATNAFYMEAKNEAVNAAHKYVENIKKIIEEKFAGGTMPKIETTVVIDSPKSAIIEEAQEWEADVIIVGSHGYGFWERMFIGSVSDAVIHHSPCSVLVIRNDEEEENKKE